MGLYVLCVKDVRRVVNRSHVYLFSYTLLTVFSLYMCQTSDQVDNLDMVKIDN